MKEGVSLARTLGLNSIVLEGDAKLVMKSIDSNYIDLSQNAVLLHVGLEVNYAEPEHGITQA